MESFAEIVPQVVLRIFTPLLCFSLAAWVVLQLPSVKSRKWSKHGKSAFAGLVSLAIVCTALSDKNTNGVNGVGGMYLMQFNPPVVQSVTPEDISNGWRVAEVSDAGAFAPPPANAVTNERWRLRGAHDDAFRIPADSWSYPFASGVTVLSRGEIRRDIRSCDFPRAFEQDPVMTIVEPSVVVSPAAFASGTFEIGQVGFGCLSITNYIGPFHVSFQGVKVAEIPCDEAIPPTGYFASPYFTGELTHTSNAGAGGLLAIKQDNYWRRDEAGRDGIINNWSPGVLVWKVPIGWKRLRYLGDSLIFADKPDYEFHTNTNSRPLLIGGRVDAYTQTFRIEADGTAVIEKFGWRLIRHPNNASGTVEKIE